MLAAQTSTAILVDLAVVVVVVVVSLWYISIGHYSVIYYVYTIFCAALTWCQSYLCIYVNLPCGLYTVLSALQDTNRGDICWQKFKMRFNDIVRDVVRFAQKIPGFTGLDLDDQVCLIKGGSFEVSSV